jgi:succinate dehydrogenase/fumarate reductase flavoprotein subunit
MNAGAIKLYLDHNIDLYSEYLEIAVCAQHCNGGVDVDENWQSNVNGLYATGEVAGTFGVYRPGGSALNSTQVGSLRVAEHIAKKQVEDGECSILEYSLPNIKYGESNISSLKDVFFPPSDS